MAHPNEELVRKAFAAFLAGDMDTISSLFAEDSVWHVPGRSRLAGAHRGFEAVIRYYSNLNEATGGTFKIDEIQDVVANDQRAIAIQKSSAKKDGAVLNFNTVLVFEIANGTIAEVWEYTNDLYEYDALIG